MNIFINSSYYMQYADIEKRYSIQYRNFFQKNSFSTKQKSTKKYIYNRVCLKQFV